MEFCCLKKLGDNSPVIEKTVAKGICRVSTHLNNREVIRNVREMFEKDPSQVNFAIKWVPVDNWCETNLEKMKEIVDKIKVQIGENEKWAMKIEKRRFAKYHSAEIICYLAENVDREVDLSCPDKILRIDILGKETAVTILKPDEIFSIRK